MARLRKMDTAKSTKDIYYFSGDVREKYNVVFADMCWQMIRTTDTGGVRMIYNGEPTVTEVDGVKHYDCGDKHKNLYDYKVSYKDAVVLDSINEGEKISILSDSMLKTMFQNENRIKYSAKFISYFLDVSYEELLKNIHLSKNELDKRVDNAKGEKCDYVALIDNTSINIEVNNNGSISVLERNMEYAHRLYSKLVKKSKTSL